MKVFYGKYFSLWKLFKQVESNQVETNQVESTCRLVYYHKFLYCASPEDSNRPNSNLLDFDYDYGNSFGMLSR